MLVEQTELQQLKQEITELKADIYTLKKNQSSRVGLPGARGEKGDSVRGADGRNGRDANLIVKTDHDTNTISVFQDGVVVAKIITIPGKDGVTGRAGTDCVCKNGRDGKDGISPSVDEIVKAVVKAINSRLS